MNKRIAAGQYFKLNVTESTSVFFETSARYITEFDKAIGRVGLTIQSKYGDYK
jgi:hypothetical protein